METDDGQSSPREIRSQVADLNGSDTENQLSSMVSQAQFATQIPLRQSPRNSKRWKNMDQQNAVPSQEYSDVVKSVQQEFAASSMADLSQRPILVPPSSLPGLTTGAVQSSRAHEQVETSCETNEVEPGTAAKMPAAVRQIFRKLREECHRGRYVPRHLQTVPNDQKKLLKSDDRWQPALVGHTQRPGTVPLDLLNRLARRADLRLSQKSGTCSVPQLQVFEHTQIRDRIPHELPGTQPCIAEETVSSSPPVEWSPSPTRDPPYFGKLPPDSSPLGSRENSSVETNQVRGKQNTDDSNVKSSASREAEQETCASRTADMTQTEATKLLLMQSESVQIPPSTLAENSIPHPISAQKTIQVKRTPFPTKDDEYHLDAPPSSTDVVPGTFDHRRNSEQKFSKTNVATTSMNELNFEVDSSEDEISVCRGAKVNSVLHASATQVQEPTSQSMLRKSVRQSKVPPLPDIIPDLKRKNSEDWLKPSKRIKDNSDQDGRSYTRDLDYRAIDEDRARYRREYLSTIARRTTSLGLVPEVPRAVPVAGDVGADAGTVSSKSSFPQRMIFDSSPRSAPIERADTSDTHVSVHGSVIVQNNENKTIGHGMPLSGTTRSAQTQLYQIYKSTYPDYGGGLKHFSAACNLLKNLYEQQKATHPSLWDDFVFHHFHEYREYLREVIESYGSAISYEKFYAENIEQPTRLYRIIKPSYITNLQTPQTSTTGSRLPTESSIVTNIPQDLESTTLHALEISATAEGSVSAAVKLTEPPHADSIVGQCVTQQSRASGGNRKDKDSHESVSCSQGTSQDSRASVRLWLQRAAGAESPILGTPQGLSKHNEDMPSIDLADDNFQGLTSESLLPRQKRSLPWAFNSTGLTKPKSSPITPIHQSTPTVAKTEVAPTKAFGIAFPKKIAKAVKPQKHPILVAVRHEVRTTVVGTESNFQRFARLYAQLPGEGEPVALLGGRPNRLIDIFSWRY